jgi:signal peptidase I
MYTYKSKSSFRNLEPKKILIRVSLVFIVSVGIGSLVKKFFIFTHKIEDMSMSPTYSKGEKLWILKPFTSLEYGKVVLVEVTKNSKLVFLGRVVGLPGDKISIKSKKLYRNGKLISEKLQNTDKRKELNEFSLRDNFNVITIPKDSYFVLCDNRDECLDSRFVGVISRSQIIGVKIF